MFLGLVLSEKGVRYLIQIREALLIFKSLLLLEIYQYCLLLLFLFHGECYGWLTRVNFWGEL
jgi:hypothetical protein